MVHATLLARANNKHVKHYLANDNTKLFIQAVSAEVGYPTSDLIVLNKGGDPKKQGTWVHKLIAIDLARWVYPPFAVQISKWVDELLTHGKVELKRPSRLLVDLTEADVEAEALEMKYDITHHSNRCCLYIAYIGNGMVKVGYSDCRLLRREEKHMSSDSEYPQFRLVGSFEISSRLIETHIHSLLSRWRVNYKNQKEIYRVDSTIREFLDRIQALLQEHDLRLQLDKAHLEIERLKNEILELRLLQLAKKNDF